MKKITFDVNFTDDNSIYNLIIGLSNLSCKMSVNFEDEIITLEELADEETEKIISMVFANCKRIISVDIDNIIEAAPEKETMEIKESNNKPKAKVSKTSQAKEKTTDAPYDEVFLSVLNDAFSKVDKNLPRDELAKSFLEAIGMETKPILVSAFRGAFYLNKICYQNMLSTLVQEHYSLTKEQIKGIMVDEFKKWAKNYPKLSTAKCQISILTLIKTFVKYFS